MGGIVSASLLVCSFEERTQALLLSVTISAGAS